MRRSCRCALELRELARLAALDQAVRHQVGPARGPMPARARDPLDHLQVAQAAGRFLQVRLERVGRVLVLGVALLLLELLRLEERRRVERALQLPSAACWNSARLPAR